MGMHNLQVDVDTEAKLLVANGMIATAMGMFYEREKDLVEAYMQRTGLDYIGTAEVIKESIVNDAFGFIWMLESKKIAAAMQQLKVVQASEQTDRLEIAVPAGDFPLGAAFCNMEPGCDSCQ